MIALALTLTVLSGTDSLAKQTLQGLSFKAPTQWTKTPADDNTLQWSEPESGAELAISVYKVDPVRPAMACLKQVVEALGTEGFTGFTLGSQPASKKIATDYLGEG